MESAVVQAALMHVACAVAAIVSIGASSPAAATLVTLYASTVACCLVMSHLRGMRMTRRLTTLLALEALLLAGVCGAFGFVPVRVVSLPFVLTFVWLGLHQPPRLALRLLPIAVAVYVTSVLLAAGSPPPLDLRGVLLVALVCGVTCAAIGTHVQRADAAARAFRLVSAVASGLHGASHRQVLDRVVKAATGLGYDGASLSIIDRRTNSFRVEHTEGIAASLAGVYPATSGLTAEVRDANSPIVVADYQRSSRRERAIADTGVRTCVGVPVYANGGLAGVLIACQLRVRRITQQDVDALVLLAAAAGKALEAARTLAVEQQLTQRLQHIAETDPLTGVANRRGATTLLENLGPGDSVAIVDLDHFKRLNDEYGHQEGDRALVMVAAHLQSALRLDDQVVRFGGEEFLLILPRTRLSDAGPLMDRVRSSWATLWPNATMSVGVAAFAGSSKETIAAADAAMYAAKAAGRNNVVTADCLSTTR